MRNKPSTKAIYWQDHVARAKTYDGSVSDYCRAHKINNQSFYQWRTKLSREGEFSQSSDFAPVTVSRGRDNLNEMNLRSHSSLPDAKWAADFVAHLIRSLA